jgi:hypothetical protein
MSQNESKQQEQSICSSSNTATVAAPAGQPKYTPQQLEAQRFFRGLLMQTDFKANSNSVLETAEKKNGVATSAVQPVSAIFYTLQISISSGSSTASPRAS